MVVCKRCGGSVVWLKVEGKWRCHNVDDGAEHWDTCSKRRWAQTKATGVRFETREAAGYEASIHGMKFERLTAKGQRGERFKVDPECKQCVPPWEICPDSCTVEFRHSN